MASYNIVSSDVK